MDKKDLLTELVKQCPQAYDVFFLVYGDLEIKPATKHKYLGIEIECAGPISPVKLQELMIVNGLASVVQCGIDGSIKVKKNGHYKHELRVLVRETHVKETLTRLFKLLNDNNFYVNSTCGLHVHLDMRTRNKNKCITNLFKFQKLLFALTTKNRWKNSYCQYRNHNTELYSKYYSFNYREKLKTIEVRVHHATMDVGRVLNWIKLLLKVIDEKPSTPMVTNKTDALEWAKKKKLVDYVKKAYNEKYKTPLEIQLETQMGVG